MKATAWLCPVLTLLCATRLVCTAQRGAYPLDYADSNMIQDDYLLEKRNKPSLSIVNPLDVLRQRLLLEIARRQMKENTRQVELNRAILKNVGKRMPGMLGRYQLALQQRQHQLQREHQLRQQHFPSQLMDYVPAAYIFDFPQRPSTAYETPLGDGKKSLDTGANKYQRNENEIANETQNRKNAINGANEGGVRGAAGGSGLAAAADSVANGRRSTSGDNLNIGEVAGRADGVVGATVNSPGLAIDIFGDVDNGDLGDDANAGYQLRYLYRAHKNNFAKK